MMPEENRRIAFERVELEEQLITAARKRRDDASHGGEQQTWHGTAFVLEAVVLIFFLALSLAVIANLFGSAHQKGQDANDLTCALALVTTESVNGAEAFAADPLDPDAPEVAYYDYTNGAFTQLPVYTSGAYSVRRTVIPVTTGGGTLYTATISVMRYDRLIYELDTQRYVSDRSVR